MADPDLIARLYPFGDTEKGWERAAKVVKKLNPSRYVGPPRSPSLEDDDDKPFVREATAPPGVDNGPPPHLELRFSQGPRTSLGFVLGKDPATSDIVLVNEKGISAQHCAITFENDFSDTKKYRLVVRDLKSTNGTSVAYDKEAGREHGGVRSDFRWIISGHPVPRRKKAIVIELDLHLKFRIVVSQHDIASELYIDSVTRFRQGVMSMDDLFGQLGLPSRPRTEAPSGARSPGTGDIVLRKKLGEGSFGVVTHTWNVGEGDECAFKEPSRKAIREKRVDRDAWKKEARIMGRVSHDHIVKLLGATFGELPQLIFEYVPGGALGDYNDISADEGVQILGQCLSALAYLHGRDPPIVHRDIKPDNILVQHRYPGDICVKFGDFGLSRETRDPTTLCGSVPWLAPEIYNERERRNAHRQKRPYTPAVDIWSLGVTVFGCVYDLPSSRASGVSWCEVVVKTLKADLVKDPDELKQFLWDNMVIMPPELRPSAQHCHEQVLLLTTQDRSATPTPASYAQQLSQDAQTRGGPCLSPSLDDGDGQQSGGQYSTEDGYREDQPTLLLHEAQTIESWTSPSLGDDDDNDEDDNDHDYKSAEIRRYARSGGVPPESESSGSVHDSWLQDPLHPLGGGSTLAAWGKEVSGSSGWASQFAETPRYGGFPDDGDLEPSLGETRKRPSRQPTSSSSSGRHRKRRGRTSISGRSSSYGQPGSEALYHREERDDGDNGSVPLEEPERADFGGPGGSCVYDYGPFHDGDTPAANAPALVHTHDRREEEWGSPWTESEARLVDALLSATHHELQARGGTPADRTTGGSDGVVSLASAPFQ